MIRLGDSERVPNACDGASWSDVTLERWELEAACIVGATRQARAIADGRTPRFPFRDEAEPWDNHVCSAIAEQGFAKWAGAYWNHGVDTFQRFGDVGAVEIRWTAMRPPKLKAKDSDADATNIVCCTSVGAAVRLHGWLPAKACKDPALRSAPRPGAQAYFVPMDRLQPMDELKAILVYNSHL